ncbi:unnamed protein product [Ectocarpus sp. CCAP 1310/34]|nr:unnamed protein product [Ectocarpus sp. CCAP 1310/34]
MIDVPGKGQLHSSAMGALKVTVSDRQGTARAIRLPFFCVSDLGRHPFTGGTAMKHGVGVLLTPKSPCLDMGSFQIPVQQDANCDSLFHFDLAIAAASVATQHAFVTISGADLPRGRANVTIVKLPTGSTTASSQGSTTASSQHTAFAAVKSSKTPANIWHKRLGHSSVQVLEKLTRTDGNGVHLYDSLSACDTCHVNKSLQNNHPKTAISDNITQPLQAVSTDLIVPISPPALGGNSYISKFTDYITRPKAVYFITHKHEALSFVFRRFYARCGYSVGSSYSASSFGQRQGVREQRFRNYCKTTGVVQTFTSPHTPHQNGISERDGRTIPNMTRCILNEARLPTFSRGEIAATSVFLINRLPHKALRGDTPDSLSFRVYNREKRRIASSRNVTFIEEPPALIPSVDASDESVSDFEDKTASPDEDIVNKGISLLEQTATESTGTSSSNTNSSRSSPAAQDPRAGKISSWLRSSVPKDLPQPDYINPRVLSPAAVEVRNTYKQAMASPQATQWEKVMRKELDSLNDHEVSDLIPFSVPAGYSIIGTRWVYRVKTDGRFKARVVVQG